MDVRGVRVLLCVLVVVGCVVVIFSPASAAGAAGVGGGDAFAVQEDDGEANETATQDDEDEGNETVAQDDEDGADDSSEDDEGMRLEDADEIHIDVLLHENGSATFTVDYRYSVGDENVSGEQWETLRDDVESEPETYTNAEAADWNGVLADGENETDREMTITDVSVTTDESSAPRDLGHVEFTFQWSSFAHVELNRIEAGDALTGFTLVDDTTLQLTWPDPYVVYEVDPQSDDQSDSAVFWDGDGTEFTGEQPRLVLIENAESNEEPTEPEEEPSMPWLAVLGALALLAAVGAAGWWIRRDRSDEPVADADAGSTHVADGATGPSEPAGPPPELLSNEERVLRLLEERGGRVKQQAVVSELEWTEAKTSQVVSGLREDDQIEVFRIGRENVLALPDDENESAGNN